MCGRIDLVSQRKKKAYRSGGNRSSGEEEEMEDEIGNLLKVWGWIGICLCYCYGVGKTTGQGFTRFVLIFPVICLFLYLPLNLHSLHFGGLTAFFVAWLANFKLILFAAGQGPLAVTAISLGNFCAVACFPIKMKQNPLQKSSETANNGGKVTVIDPKSNQNHRQSPLNYAVKILLVAALVKAYDYSHILPQKLFWLLLSLHIYLLLDLSLSAAAAAVAHGGAVELLPLFHHPYLSTSLQDFWGRRWNLVVTGILRPAAYRPAANAATKLIGPRWAPLVGVAATFLVSAAMHELMFFYMSRQWPPPTWEVAAFFVLHGGCLVAEMVAKRLWIDTWGMPSVPAAISIPVTMGFFFWTCFWLFFPPLINACNAEVRVVEEYAIFGAFVKNNVLPTNFKYLW